ncbi:MAG: DUF2497 domain-containing protein [Kiloniellales bacterium]
MSEATKQEQQEPSMEEILASIRRIISDDGTEQPALADGEAKPQPADADSAAGDTETAATAATEESAEDPMEAAPVAEETAAPEAAAGDTGSGGAIDLRADHGPDDAEPMEPAAPTAAAQDEELEDEEPLDLTEAVQDDGTVIDLAAQRAAQARANAPAVAPDDDMAMADATEEAAASPEVEAEMPIPDDDGLELYAEDSDPAENDPIDMESDPMESAAMESATGESAPAESDPMDGDIAAPEPESDSVEPAFGAVEDDMSDSPKSNDLEHERLVSEATEAAALATLSAVAHPPTAESSQPIVGGERTLEQVVRDAIAEHLKVWLDANLPELVERVVREEVRRLARRAEDT